MQLVNSIILGLFASLISAYEYTSGTAMNNGADISSSGCSNVTLDHYNAQVKEGISCHYCGDKIALTHLNRTVVVTVSDSYVSSVMIDMVVSETAFKALVPNGEWEADITWECL